MYSFSCFTTTPRYLTILLASLLLAVAAPASAEKSLSLKPAAGVKSLKSPAKVLYNYTATTQSNSKKQGTVMAGSLKWQCRGNRCTIKGPWPTPGVSSCHKLAQSVGLIKSYGHPGKKLTSGQIQQCNKGIAGVASKTTGLKQLPTRTSVKKTPLRTTPLPETRGKLSPQAKTALGSRSTPASRLPPAAMSGKVVSPKAIKGGSDAESLSPAERRTPASAKGSSRMLKAGKIKPGQLQKMTQLPAGKGLAPQAKTGFEKSTAPVQFGTKSMKSGMNKEPVKKSQPFSLPQTQPGKGTFGSKAKSAQMAKLPASPIKPIKKPAVQTKQTMLPKAEPRPSKKIPAGSVTPAIVLTTKEDGEDSPDSSAAADDSSSPEADTTTESTDSTVSEGPQTIRVGRELVVWNLGVDAAADATASGPVTPRTIRVGRELVVWNLGTDADTTTSEPLVPRTIRVERTLVVRNLGADATGTAP